MRSVIALLLLLGVASADQIRIDWRDGTTGNFAPRNLTTLPNYVLTFDANGNPVIGPGGGVGVTDGDKGDITVSGGGTVWTIDSAGEVSLDALPDGQEIRGATVASIIIGAGKGVGETTILAPWDVDGAVDGAPRITMTSGNSPTLAINSPTVDWGDGIKQVFNPSATTAGLNVGALAGDPSALANGDLWYDSTANELTARINGANVALGAGGPGGGGVAAGDSPTWTGAHTFTRAGAASAPTVSLTGAPFTGGDATTTKPLLLLEPTGTTSTGWSTSGTLLGANAAAGFTGNLIDAQVAGASKFKVSSAGDLVVNPTGTYAAIAFADRGNILRIYNSAFGDTQPLSVMVQAGVHLEGAAPSLTFGNARDLWLSYVGPRNVRLGAAASATPLAQTFTLGEASRPGSDTNTAGANGTIQSGLGTGTGTASSLIFQTPTVAGAGSGVRTYGTRMTLSSAGATFPESTTPGTPSANNVVLYAKADGLLYSKDDAGAEIAVSGGGGGTPTVEALTDAATVTPNAGSYSMGELTELSQTTAFATPSGSPANGQNLTLIVKSTTARAISFSSGYDDSDDMPFPTMTSGSSKTDLFKFLYNTTKTKWLFVGEIRGF